MNRTPKSVREKAAGVYARTIFTRTDLLQGGMSGRQITAAVRAGALKRVRKNRYAVPQTSDDVIEAVRIGGRISCLTLLKCMGIFVHRCDFLHVHVDAGTSRLRAPLDERAVVHWHASAEAPRTLHASSLVDAVRQAIRCQQPRAALATLDSVLHHGLMTREQLKNVFAGLPARFRPLLDLVDGSAASGPETFMRLLLRTLGVRFESQVELQGVGRVDFVVEGWLIVECDSREFHAGWDQQVEDRRRDTAAAELGFVTIRPLARDIMDDPASTRRSLIAVLAALGPRLGVSGRSQLLKNV